MILIGQGGHNRSLDVLAALKETLQFFDKDLISQSPIRSYKMSGIMVDGYLDQRIPHESVYDVEVLRILGG